MGEDSQIPVDPDFPNSRANSYLKSSEPTLLYNCVAWAMGESHRWWEPKRFKFWPANVRRDYSKEALVQAYEKFGFVKCENGDLEAGFTKVALYTENNIEYSHAARWDHDEIWKSKLGKNIDIDHTLEALKGGIYGDIYQFMKRKTEQ